MSKKNGDAFVSLQKLFKPYKNQLAEAVQTILEQDVSNYPILVASQQVVELGIPLLQKEQMTEGWSINASTLEEFHAKQVIATDKIDDFRSLYKTHADELCIFVLTDEQANFIFMPL